VLLADPSVHPTELMDLRGARFAVVEETPEARRLSVVWLKKTVGAPQITARHIRQNDVTFDSTHSLFLTSNYRPVVEETDHGTWRRLALPVFPYLFRKPRQPLKGANDRRGDPQLRHRVFTSENAQRAVLRYLVDGARKWYEVDHVVPPPPKSVETDTSAWRAESDLPLAYWHDRLVADRERHVMAAGIFVGTSTLSSSSSSSSLTSSSLSSSCDGS
jgi:phage/plasmid-associated DNA primase